MQKYKQTKVISCNLFLLQSAFWQKKTLPPPDKAGEKLPLPETESLKKLQFKQLSARGFFTIIYLLFSDTKKEQVNHLPFSA